MHIRRLTDEETGTLIFCEKWYIAITANVSQYQPHDKNTYHGNVDSSITCSIYDTPALSQRQIVSTPPKPKHGTEKYCDPIKLN